MPLTRWLGGLSVPTEIPEPLAVFPIRKMRERVPAYLVENFFVLFFARSATFLYTVVIPSISASFPANRYCSAKISIDEIASQTYYSTDHFRVLFKKRVGKTPKAYILDKRLDYAKQLMLESNLSLFEISELCGFTDYIQFNKFFKKKEGVGPNEFLKIHGLSSKK